MNRFAYRTTGYAVKALEELSKARIFIYGQENIPKGPNVYVINHFTRIETFLAPYHINRLTHQEIWSLADYSLFEGSLGKFLNQVGAVSTRNPDRDLLIVKTLLTGEASWIIFPEGRMVKSKKIFEKGRKKDRFVVGSPEGEHPPHSGAATLALRTEFYRERLRHMMEVNRDEADRLMALYQLDSIEPVLEQTTHIVPVNFTYYPIRARENVLSRLADNLIGNLSARMLEEIMTEGTMLISGVDLDIRFGEAIKVRQYMKSSAIQADIADPTTINFDDPITSRKMMRKSSLNITERYMNAIYNMTTVNHDHIFASILKYLPFNEMSEDDFRRRAYLATSLNLDKIAVKRHHGLNINQIHLLTDDRYQRYSNFMSIALEKSALIRKKGKLIRNRYQTGKRDFHRVRIENPISVIVNEVEPLTKLQNHLRRIAWQPGNRIRYWIAKHLLEKAVFEFDRDYTNYFIKGESKDKLIGRPFLIHGSDKEIGVVLVHGYMAAPAEVKALAQFLGSKGYTVYVPRLKGHGTSPQDLATRKYSDWIETVEEAYAIIQNTCKQVVMGGFSTGAGLALDICTRVENVAGVFAIAPPLKLQDFSARLVPAVNLWNRLMEKVSLGSAKKEFVENHPENPSINYKRNPISGLVELEKLMNALAPKLNRITVPALVVQGHGDPVVDPDGSRKVFERLGSEEKEYLLINANRHGIINGQGAWRVYRAVEDFLEKIT